MSGRGSLAAILLVVSACGGSTTGSGGGGTPFDPPPQTYQQYLTTEASLRTAWSGVGYTDLAALPHSGTARYDGVMAVNVAAGTTAFDLMGASYIVIDFQSDTLSGAAAGFIAQNGADYTGSLLITNGILDRNADPNAEFAALGDVTGSLNSGGSTVNLTLQLQGNLLGAAYGAVDGTVQGLVTIDTVQGVGVGTIVLAQ